MTWQLSQRENYALSTLLNSQGLALLATDILASWAHRIPKIIRPQKLAQVYDTASIKANAISQSLIGAIRRSTKTVRWYLDHPGWIQGILDGSYRLERLGNL